MTAEVDGIETPECFRSKIEQSRAYMRVVDLWEPIYRAHLDDVMNGAPPRSELEARTEYIRLRMVPRDFSELRRHHLPALGRYAARAEELKALAGRISGAKIEKPPPPPPPITPFSDALFPLTEQILRACSDEFDRRVESMCKELEEYEGKLEEFVPVIPDLDPLEKRQMTSRRNRYKAICHKVGDRYVPSEEAIERARDELMAKEKHSFERFVTSLWTLTLREYRGGYGGRKHPGPPTHVTLLSAEDLRGMLIEVEYADLYVERWMVGRTPVVLPSLKAVSKYYVRKIRYAMP